MFIELLDTLRCVRSHEDTWLVASFDRMEGRRIIDGTLGCPICRASYAIRDGIVWLGTDESDALPDEDPVPVESSEDDTMRLAALLDLREPASRALLCGTTGIVAHALVAATQAELLLVDPPTWMRTGEGVSIARTGGRLPFAPASMRAIALDARASAAMDEATATLRDGGRLVAPESARVPDEVTELARDERQWVAARKTRPSAPVQLTLMRGGRDAS